jgi:hypothetical protein
MNSNIIQIFSTEAIKQSFTEGTLMYSQSILFDKLDSNLPVEKKLNFIGEMTFFVLGFKDLMGMIRFDEPKGRFEEAVNKQCEEDSQNWKWFLEDLAILNQRWLKENSINVITEIWDDENIEVRKTQYIITSYFLQITNASARMLILEVLEICFAYFTSKLKTILIEEGLYNTLNYFGRSSNDLNRKNPSTHLSDDELLASLPQELSEQMPAIIDEVFMRMRMFIDVLGRK